MILNLIPVKEPEVVESERGRFYLFDGNLYPSITTILSRTKDSSGLDEWKKRVGSEEASRISRQASSHGTELHLLMENFLHGHEIPKASFKSQQVFNLLKRIIPKRISVVYGTEYPLCSHQLKVAGRTDLICSFDGIPSILDWKTSKEPGMKDREYIKDYFLQPTFYARCVNESNVGIEIKQGVLVFCNPFGIHIEVFNVADYDKQLDERVQLYYNSL